MDVHRGLQSNNPFTGQSWHWGEQLSLDFTRGKPLQLGPRNQWWNGIIITWFIWIENRIRCIYIYCIVLYIYIIHICAPIAGIEQYSGMEHQTKTEQHSASTTARSNLFTHGYRLVVQWLTKSMSKMGAFGNHLTRRDDTCETCGHLFFNQRFVHVW